MSPRSGESPRPGRVTKNGRQVRIHPTATQDTSLERNVLMSTQITRWIDGHEDHDQSADLRRALTEALATWTVATVTAGLLWRHDDGWTVRTDTHHSHVMITGPGVGQREHCRQAMHWHEPDPAVLLGVLVTLGAPEVATTDDALVDALTADWAVTS
jgi:hypothetical protein